MKNFDSMVRIEAALAATLLARTDVNALWLATNGDHFKHAASASKHIADVEEHLRSVIARELRATQAQRHPAGPDVPF